MCWRASSVPSFSAVPERSLRVIWVSKATWKRHSQKGWRRIVRVWFADVGCWWRVCVLAGGSRALLMMWFQEKDGVCLLTGATRWPKPGIDMVGLFYDHRMSGLEVDGRCNLWRVEESSKVPQFESRGKSLPTRPLGISIGDLDITARDSEMVRAGASHTWRGFIRRGSDSQGRRHCRMRLPCSCIFSRSSGTGNTVLSIVS